MDEAGGDRDAERGDQDGPKGLQPSRQLSPPLVGPSMANRGLLGRRSHFYPVPQLVRYEKVGKIAPRTAEPKDL
jgi:hypothetical protein